MALYFVSNTDIARLSQFGGVMPFDLQKSHQNFDEDEDIELVAYTIEELIEKVMSNEIQDVKTMAAILAYYYK